MIFLYLIFLQFSFINCCNNIAKSTKNNSAYLNYTIHNKNYKNNKTELLITGYNRIYGKMKLPLEIIDFIYSILKEIEITFNHGDLVKCLQLNPEGDKLISASKNLKLWDLKNNLLLKTFDNHQNIYTYCLKFIKNSKYILSGDTCIRLWEISNGQLHRIFRGHKDCIYDIDFDNKDTIFSASADKSIKVWSLNKNKLIKTLVGHTQSVMSVKLTYDNKFIISGGMDQSIKLWNIQNWNVIKSIKGHDSSVIYLRPSTKNYNFITSGGNYELKLWKIDDSSITVTDIIKTKSYIYKMVFDLSENLIFFANYEGEIKLWNRFTNRVISLFKKIKNNHTTEALDIDNANRYLVFNSDSEIKFIDLLFINN